MRFPCLSGLGVGRGRDDGVADRPEVPDEGGVADAQPDLSLGPRTIGHLCTQHVAHRVADRDQAADDAGRLRGDPLVFTALFDGDRDGGAVHDLHQPPGLADEVGALLDFGPFCRGTAANSVRNLVFFGRFYRSGPRRRENPCRKLRESHVEQIYERRIAGAWPAGIGRVGAVDAAPQSVLAEHHFGMCCEIFVDLDGVAVLSGDRDKVDPFRDARCLAVGAALQDEDVDDDVGAGRSAHAPLGQPHRADEVGERGDVLAGSSARLVHRAGAGDEDREAAGP